MANGLFGKKALDANSNFVVCTVPDNKVATLTISVCNRTIAPIKLRLWIGGAVPTDDDVIEYDFDVKPNAVMERTGIAASAGEKVVAWAAGIGLTIRVHGFEEAA